MTRTHRDGFGILSVYLVLIFGFLSIKHVESACGWPSQFESTYWWDSAKGDINFQTATMTGWYIYTADMSTTVSEWDCVTVSTFNTDGRMIFRTSSAFQLFSTSYFAYVCLTLTRITDNSYRYYINRATVPTLFNQRVFLYTLGTLTEWDSICDSNGATGSEYQVLVKEGSESTTKIDCPWSFLGRYRYTHTTSTNTQSCDITTSELSTCTATTEMAFDYAACSTKVAYSTSDTVWCVSNVNESGTNYVTVFNGNDPDGDIDDTNTFKFTCFAIYDDASQASVSPRHCQKDQTPNQYPVTNSGSTIGALLQFSSALETCRTCPDLTNPDRGVVTISTTDTTITATYTCNSSFTLKGGSTRTCQSDETWAGSAPYCSCATPSTPSNGALVVNTEGTIATYTCNLGYTIDGVSTRTCQIATATWDNTDPTCVECTSIPTAAGRLSTLTRTSSGTVTVATLTCSTGYTLSGSSPLTCQSDGSWDNSIPTCVYCDVLTNPQSGTVSIATSAGISTASYACSSGYSLMGTSTRTCQTDGSWDGTPPTCQCNTPPTPANGNVVSDGSSATYTCSLNYTINGASTRTCGTDGSGWSGSDPSCASCSAVTGVSGGAVVLSTSGTVTTAKYTCDLGYSLDGSSTLTCQSSGSWNAAQSTCAQCPTLSDPSSGTVTITSSGIVTLATYACASGYDLSGSTIRLCDSNGDWSLTEPSCTCQTPALLMNGQRFSTGLSVTYTCELGFTLDGVASRTCGSNGSGWSDSDPSCVMCVSMYAPTDGTILFSTDDYNTMATFTCDLGYTLNGVTPITCFSDGSWNSTQPTCAKCPDLSNPSSGNVSLSTDTITTVATFSCVSGYYLSGSFQLTCQSDAAWSSADPMCKCNFPPNVANGVVSVSDSATGTTATYTCNEGHTLSGLSTRQCQTDGTGWEGSDPSCVNCQAVSLVTFGSFTLTTNNTHTRVSFQCNVGTTLNGESEGACLENGSWDNAQPTCVPCPTLTNPDSGSVSLSTTGIVSTATYTCTSGYTLTSGGTLQCQTDGTWDTTPPTCICNATPTLLNGQVSISSDLSVTSYSCDSGYVIVGSLIRYCQNDGTGWNGTQPTCELCTPLSTPTGGSIVTATDGQTTTANYTCTAGFSLFGEHFITCQQDQTWDNDIPYCAQCQVLNTPSSIVVVMTTDGHVTTASFTCVSGYTKIGPDSQTCLSDGTWTSTSPVCECNDPPVLQNGFVIADGNTANYSCSLGFSLSGTAVRPCLDDGTGWSGTDPACALCATLATPAGGTVTLSTTGTVTSATYTCSSGYTLSGQRTVECLSSGLWETLPTCVECQQIEAPDSESISVTSNGTVSMVTYACAAGYDMTGVSTRTCLSGGTWTSAAPTCSCQSPSQPSNGQVNADGYTATYTCQTGYTMSGQSVRTCTTDGTGWSASDPVCVKCAELSSVDGGSFTTTTDGLKTTVSYACTVGYTLKGITSMTCDSTGTWNSTAPECVLCPTLVDPSSGNVAIATDGYTSTATFSCATGYYASGASSFACLTTGLWANDSSTCKCNLPPQPADGIVSVLDTDSGQIASYTCDTGYTLFGLSSRLCQADGRGWQDTDPTCTSCTLSSTPPETSAVLSTDGLVTRITYTCAMNYTLSGTSVQVCQANGTWSDNVPTCTSCSGFTAPNGGNVTIATNGLVTSLSYTCDVGYTLNGLKGISCNADGSWNGTEPMCVSCPALSDPASGKVSTFTDGYVTTATFTCVSGYYLSGQTSVSCQTTGQWNGNSPTCECNFPTSSDNGDVSVKDTVAGTVAEFTCNASYTLSGSASRLCKDDGTGWTGTEPTCVSCTPSSTPPETSAVISTNGVVTTITYTCAMNYTLSGTSVQVCQSDGSWSDNVPTCNLCPQITTPSGGSVSIVTDTLMTSVSYACDVGYTLNGPHGLSCQSDGNWNGTEPTCVSCSGLSGPDNGAVSTSTDGYVTTTTFTCVSGYYLSGQSTVSCQTTGQWDGNAPTCELIAAAAVASTEDSSEFPIHIGLFISLLILIAVLLGLVVFCAYRRFKNDKNHPITALESIEITYGSSVDTSLKSTHLRQEVDCV